jgi:hypothetical protein
VGFSVCERDTGDLLAVLQGLVCKAIRSAHFWNLEGRTHGNWASHPITLGDAPLAHPLDHFMFPAITHASCYLLYGVRTVLVRSIPHASARLTRDDQERAMFGTGCGPPCRTQESSGLLGVGGSWAVGMKYSTVLYFTNRMPLEASCISQYEVFFAIRDYAGGWSWRLFFFPISWNSTRLITSSASRWHISRTSFPTQETRARITD